MWARLACVHVLLQRARGVREAWDVQKTCGCSARGVREAWVGKGVCGYSARGVRAAWVVQGTYGCGARPACGGASSMPVHIHVLHMHALHNADCYNIVNNSHGCQVFRVTCHALPLHPFEYLTKLEHAGPATLDWPLATDGG